MLPPLPSPPTKFHPFHKSSLNLQLVTPALIRSSAMVNDGAIFVDLPRTKNQKRSASVIDTPTEFAVKWREQQAMRVCVGPDMSWLNFVGRRLSTPDEDGEDTISKLRPIGERLTNLLQNYSAEAFRQINDQLECSSPVTLTDEVYLGWRSSIQVQISCRLHGLVSRSRSLPNCRSHADFPILWSAAQTSSSETVSGGKVMHAAALEDLEALEQEILLIGSSCIRMEGMRSSSRPARFRWSMTLVTHGTSVLFVPSRKMAANRRRGRKRFSARGSPALLDR